MLVYQYLGLEIHSFQNDFMKYFVASIKSDFVLTKYFAKMIHVLLTEPCNLHDLYSCIDSNKCFHTLLNISLFLDTGFYQLSNNNNHTFITKLKLITIYVKSITFFTNVVLVITLSCWGDISGP